MPAAGRQLQDRPGVHEVAGQRPALPKSVPTKVGTYQSGACGLLVDADQGRQALAGVMASDGSVPTKVGTRQGGARCCRRP
ncbi:hypothetical protein D5301_09280 [Stenotrophomonas sp. MH181796]|nr:hypothetical protein [Stenotrophomonas sp. MH181796]